MQPREDTVIRTWSPVQQKVQQWLAMPKDLRPDGLRTKAAIARLLNVPATTLYRWQVLPGWWNEVFKFARLQIGEDVGAILKAMVREALAGDVRAAKLCLETLGVHADKLILEGHIKHDQLLIILDPEADGTDRQLLSSTDTTAEEQGDGDGDEDGETAEEQAIIVFEELFAEPPQGEPQGLLIHG